MNLCPCIVLFPLYKCQGFVYNKPQAKFTYRSNHTEHYWTCLYYLTRTKHDCTSAGCIFDRNTPVAGHKQRTVGFPQCNSLRRSNGNSTVTICTSLFVSKYFSLNLEERVHLGDPVVDGRIILRWIFKDWDVGLQTGSSWLRIGGHLWMR